MKAYKDLDKTLECEDGDLVAVLEMDGVDFIQQQPERRPAIDDDDILDAGYVYD